MTILSDVDMQTSRNRSQTLWNQRFHVLVPLPGLIFAACWVSVVSSIATAGHENLLANGQLETADASHPDRPRGFQPGRIGKSFAEMTWTTPGYKSRRCVAITTKDSSGLGYWQTLVTVKPETTYTISLFYKAGLARACSRSRECRGRRQADVKVRQRTAGYG